jgi:hypothetical protein
MEAVPFSRPTSGTADQTGSRKCRSDAPEQETMSWVGFAAGGTLAAAALLLLSGQRRAGMVAAASGTALAMLEQPETLRSWWNALPGYIDQAQQILGQVQDAVNEVAVKREALRRVLAR